MLKSSRLFSYLLIAVFVFISFFAWDLNFPVFAEDDGPCGGECPLGQVCDLATYQCVDVGGPGGGGGGNGGGGGSASLPNFLGSGVNSVSDLVLKIVDFLIKLAVPFAVLMLVWAGFQFATAQGSEEKLKTAKKNLLWTVIGLAVILASGAIVGYVTSLLGGSGNQGAALMGKLKAVFEQIYSLLFISVTAIFGWGIVQFMRASSGGDSAKLEEGKRHMVWGIIGMAVMAGAWGIVKILQSFLN